MAGPEAEKEARLRAAAGRALSEADARRKEADARPPLPPELGGRDGPEPTRFGDWETEGVVSDF